MFGRKLKTAKEDIPKENIQKKRKRKMITEELPPVCRSLPVELADGFSVRVGVAQQQGDRSYQEDSYGFSTVPLKVCGKSGFMALLADGMGGLSDGKAVSEMVIGGMLTQFEAAANTDQPICDGTTLLGALCKVNDAVCDRFCPTGSVRSGSTAVCALVFEKRLHWACIGDSRLYLVRQGRMYQVNEDTDCLNLLLNDVLDGKISYAMAAANPQKDALADCIGKREPEHPDRSITGFPLRDGDRLVLCSDGVYNALEPEEFQRLLAGDAQDAAERVAQAVVAKHYPHQDNLTLTVISCAEKQGS